MSVNYPSKENPMIVIDLSVYPGESIVKCNCGYKFYMNLSPFAKRIRQKVQCPKCCRKHKLIY